MIFRDVYEPIQIEELVNQAVPCIKANLNHELGIADYTWFAWDSHRIQVERKQIDEVLSGMDKVEELLQREMTNGVEETILLIEGECEPVPGVRNAVQSFKKAKSRNILVPSHKYNKSYSGYQAWLYQLDKAGVTVVKTPHYIATAHTLVALYKSSQEKTHKTLQRYIKDKIVAKTDNPHVITLMGIKNGGVGEEFAKALIDRFGTVWYTLNRDPEDLASTIVGNQTFGMVRSKKLLRATGRTV
jgi:ERCC4-type nuclease